MANWQSQLTHKLFKRLTFSIPLIIFSINTSYATPVVEESIPAPPSIPQMNYFITQEQISQALIEWKNTIVRTQPPKENIIHDRLDVSQNTTQIFGTLTSSGQLILINSKGIFFGPINKESKNKNNTNNANPSVSPKTTTTTTANANATDKKEDEVIQGKLSQVKLDEGNKYIIDFYGDGLVNFVVNEDTESSKIASPKKKSTAKNGKNNSEQGEVVIAAKNGGYLADRSINLKGIAEATSVEIRKGEIVLLAEEEKVSKKPEKKIMTNPVADKKDGLYKLNPPLVHFTTPNIWIQQDITGSGVVAMDKSSTLVR